jgi:hypothetical protein
MPQIQMTRTAKIALYGLRIYLLVLLTLIGIKFVRTFMSAPPPAAPAASPAPERHGIYPSSINNAVLVCRRGAAELDARRQSQNRPAVVVGHQR